MMLYLLPFLLSFTFSILLCALFIFLFHKKNITNSRIQDRHIHLHNVSRFGGVAVIAAFILTVLLDKHLVITPQIAGIIFAGLAIIAIGVWDDLCELGWKVQFLFQAAIISSMFLFGFDIAYISNPLGGVFVFEGAPWGKIMIIVLLFVWMLAMMNAMNWIDGIDGFSGGITLVASVVIFLLSLKPEVNQPPVAIMAVVLIGAVLGFLVFNFYPAKIFAGTSGSLFFGFILAALSVIAGTKIATTLLVVAVPIIDALWVIVQRMRAKQSIFHPDKRHIHHRLIELGWSQRKISMFFSIVTAGIAVVALETRAMGKVFAMGVVFLIVVVVFFYLRMGVSRKANQIVTD